jgi:hypothetical protein
MVAEVQYPNNKSDRENSLLEERQPLEKDGKSVVCQFVRSTKVCTKHMKW